LQQMINGNDTLAAPYIGYLAHTVEPCNRNAAQQLLVDLSKRYGNNPYVADAIISNLENNEDAFYKKSIALNPDTSLVLNKRLRKVMDDIAKAKSGSNAKALAKAYPKGAALFQSVCQTCHGADGNGVSALAPPLNNSNWVQGDKNKLIPIVLYGLTGPIKVGGKLYTSPEINGDMPGIGANKEFTDDDIAQVLSFIRQSWNNKAGEISTADISNTRNKYKDRQKTFTMDELNRSK
jgi:mono/diheme cytochrome c family protein